MFRRIAVILLLPVLLISNTGCWGKTELNEIGIVTTTGVDMEPDGSIRITVMSVQPEGLANAPLVRSMTWIGTATGADLVNAAKNLRSTAVKKLSWIHNNIIIIGQEAAKNKMTEVVDFFSRNREIRFSNYILVAGGRAFDMMQTPPDLHRDLPTEILGIIRNLNEWSKSYVSNAKEFLISYAERCGDLVTGKIWYMNEKMNTFSTDRENYEKLYLNDRKLPIAYMEGCAVFRQGSMVGWLDGPETRGFLWITGKIKPGAIIAAGKSGMLAMENIFSSTSIDIKEDDGGFKAVVKVDVRGTLMEQTTKDDIRKPEVMQKVEDDFSVVIKSEMEKAVDKLQKQYNVDVFRFGLQLNRQHPQEWKRVEKDWENTAFSRLKVEYDVHVTIERTGKIIRTIM